MIKLILFLLPLNLFAGEFSFLKAKKLHIEATKAIGTNRHWTIPDGEKKEGNLNLYLELADNKNYLFLRSKVDSFYTDSQFRYVSLIQELAIEPYHFGMEFYIRHQSEHALDWRYNVQYPNQNEIGIRFKFIDR